MTVRQDPVTRLDDLPAGVVPSPADMQSEAYRLVVAYIGGRRGRREISASTALRQRAVLTGFAVNYGHRPVRNMSRADVERWLATRSAVSPGTRRYEWVTLRNFTVWLRAERHMKVDPFAGLKAPRVPRTVPRAMPRNDIDRLRAALPDARARAVFALMYGCGLRRIEVCHLEIGDYDPAARTIVVRHGKGGHQRLIPVIDWVADEIAAYLRQRPAAAGPLVRSTRSNAGLSPKYLSTLMRRWMEDAGVKAYAGDGRACHSLRHTIASEVAEQPDVPLTVVQQLLGHVQLSSTQVYLRHAELHRVRAALEAATVSRHQSGFAVPTH